jgi:hypothetical protein
MSAIALSLVISDVLYNNIDYVAIHAILGGLTSILFFKLCNYGYEYVNWVLLLLMFVFILISFISKMASIQNEDSTVSECNTCNKPINTCGCSE